MKRAIVTGAAGFIGNHLVEFLKEHDYHVRGVDIVPPRYRASSADEFVISDLRLQDNARRAFTTADEVYLLAAEMGGMGFLDGSHDVEVGSSNVRINLNSLESVRMHECGRVMFASSACVYPDAVDISQQSDLLLKEEDAEPWMPSTGAYGWEKTFTEQMCRFYRDEYSLDTGIVRFHNVFGPYGSWNDGREKAPAALCRKTIDAIHERLDFVQIWGSGDQRRTFLYIDDAVQGIWNIAKSGYSGPVNVGSDRSVSIIELVEMIFEISGFHGVIEPINGPTGVVGRGSDNSLYEEITGKMHETSLEAGLEWTYQWIARQLSTLNSTRKVAT